MGDGELDEEGGAVVVADGADVGVHVFGEFGGDVEAEAGRVGAEGDADWRGQIVAGEFVVDVFGEGGAEVADGDADFFPAAGDGELGGGALVGVFDGVDAEVVDDGAEEFAVGDDEAVFVGVADLEVFLIEAKEVFELADNFFAEAADGDGFHLEEAVFEAGDFGEVVDLAHGAVGDGDEFLLVFCGSYGVVWVEGEGKLAHQSEGRFEFVRRDKN